MRKYGLLIYGCHDADQWFVTKAQMEQFEVLTDFDLEVPLRKLVVATGKSGQKKPIFDRFARCIIVEESNPTQVHLNILNGARDAFNAYSDVDFPNDVPLYWDEDEININKIVRTIWQNFINN